MLCDNKGASERSDTVALILKTKVSEKYTPPLFVGRFTGVADFEMTTFSSKKVLEAKHKTKSNLVDF